MVVRVVDFAVSTAEIFWYAGRMAEPNCLKLAKKLVRVLNGADDVAFGEKKRALAIAALLFESSHYAPGSGEFGLDGEILEKD